MALTQLFTDSFSGYANQAAFEAAYSNVAGLTWGLTEGPGGTPGIVAVAPSAGTIRKLNLNPCGRQFRVAGTFDWSGNAEHPILIYWTDGTTRSENIVDIWRSTVNINVSVQTINSGGFDPNRYSEWASDTNPAFVVTSGVANVVRVEGLISTLTETSPGVFVPNADGYVRVYFDNVLWFEYANQEIWNGQASQDLTRPYWNAVQIKPTGRFTNFEVWHDDACDGASVAVVDNTDVCCSTGDGGNAVPTGGGQGNGATPVQYPAIGAQLECAGGGTVPTQVDLVHSEGWS